MSRKKDWQISERPGSDNLQFITDRRIYLFSKLHLCVREVSLENLCLQGDIVHREQRGVKLGNIFPFDLAIEVTLTHEPSHRWWHRPWRVPVRACAQYIYAHACFAHVCVCVCVSTPLGSHVVLFTSVGGFDYRAQTSFDFRCGRGVPRETFAGASFSRAENPCVGYIIAPLRHACEGGWVERVGKSLTTRIRNCRGRDR